jgi:hypothetical protein
MQHVAPLSHPQQLFPYCFTFFLYMYEIHSFGQTQQGDVRYTFRAFDFAYQTTSLVP